MTADAKFLSSSVFLLSDPITGTLASICYGFYTKNENTKIIYENISLDLKVCFFFVSDFKRNSNIFVGPKNIVGARQCTYDA